MNLRNLSVQERLEYAWKKRKAAVSNVLVFKTADPHLLEEMIKFYVKQFNKLCAATERIFAACYLFIQGKGLYRVNVSAVLEKDEVIEEKVTVNTPVGPRPVVDLSNAINVLREDIFSHKTILAFLYNLFDYRREVEELVRAMILDYSIYEYQSTLIIATEFPRTVLPNSLDLTIFIDDLLPNEEDRKKFILEKSDSIAERFRNGQNPFRENEDLLNKVVKETRGFNYHMLESLLLEAEVVDGSLDRIFETIRKMKIEFIRRAGLIIEEAKYKLDKVAGFEKLKTLFNKVIIPAIEKHEKALKLGVKPPRGILMFGPPGCGKTWFAKALAKELGLPFVRFNASQIWNKYVGESEKAVERLIQALEMAAPCVLFIDEIDQLGIRSDISTDSGTTRRVFSRLLEWLGDESENDVIVIGSTNRPDLLDPAFIRAGRFDYLIPILYPSTKTRKEILELHVQLLGMEIADDVNFEQLATMTELWNSAELRELVRRAARIALMKDRDKVTMEDFIEAYQTFSISYERRIMELAIYLQFVKHFANDISLIDDYDYIKKIEERIRKYLEEQEKRRNQQDSTRYI